MLEVTMRDMKARWMLLPLALPWPVWGPLPTPVAPSTGPAAGDWIGLIEGYIKDGGLVLGLALAVMGFLWVAYLTFAKFNEARQGKAEWAEVGVLAIAWLAGVFTMGFGIAGLGTVATVVVMASVFQRLKRNRPDGYYQQRIVLWLDERA